MTTNHTDKVTTVDIQPFLMPISVLLVGIFLSSGIFFGLSNIGNSLKGGVVAGVGTTTSAGTTTTTGTTGTQTASLDQIKSLFVDGNLVFGNKDSKLLFVEFTDPSCPYCHIAAGKNPELNKSAGFTLVADGGTYVAPVTEMKKLVDEGKAAMVIIYTNGHGNGRLGAQAMYCANEKGKFWEVHDLLMTNAGYNLINNEVKNDKANSGKLASFLASVIDSNFMNDCLSSAKYEAKITSDDSSAATYGVNGTPGFFINDRNFAGAYSWNDMKGVAEQYL